MKEPKDTKARNASMKKFIEHIKDGGTVDSWNESNEINAFDLRETLRKSLEMYERKELENMNEWQLCPKCNGVGSLWQPFTTPVTEPVICDLCNGKKIISKNRW